MSKLSADFQLKRSMVVVTGCQKPQEIAAYLACVYLWAASPAAQAPGTDCELMLHLIYCQCQTRSSTG